jgi:hypothetical protein
VREADLLKLALSAYNAGAGGALAGYRKGDSDSRTTGHDYGSTSRGGSTRAEVAVRGATTSAGVDGLPLLRPGARGPAGTARERGSSRK